MIARLPGAFPLPGCPTCGAQLRCEARGSSEPNYPRCRVPLRGTSLERVSSLFRYFRAFHQFEDPALHQLEQEILKLFGHDDFAWSDSLELSISADAAGWHLFRFSYALPWYAKDRDGAEEAMVACAAPFGAVIAEATRARMLAGRSPCVELPIAGVAYEGPGRWRQKIYLQFKDDMSDEALRVAEAVTGFEGLARRYQGQPLHLLGVDTRADGSVSEAKLYFMHRRYPTNESPIPFVRGLRHLGVTELKKLLLINRVRADDFPAEPSELDFSLLDNDLLWEDLAPLPQIMRHLTHDNPWEQLRRSFRTGVRRISVPLRDENKLNVYYVLAETKS
jgi:hypothetical protein